MTDIREGSCPHCRHNQIIQSAPVTFVLRGDVPKPLSAAAGVDPAQLPGALNIFICRRCGFTQWFAFAPAEIPLGPQFGTRLIQGSADNGPYR
jgi:hypothetical protein